MNYDDYYDEIYLDIYLEFGSDAVSDPDYAESLKAQKGLWGKSHKICPKCPIFDLIMSV